jgi:hypothetical protein
MPFEWMQDGWHSLSSVIAGLDPAIHLLCKNALAKRMDPRVKPVKPAGDAGEWVSAELGRELIKVKATASSEGPRACDAGKAPIADEIAAVRK